MAKKSNHRAVVFLQDYATKSAGDQFTCDGMLASSLVSRGIAEYKTENLIIEYAPKNELKNIVWSDEEFSPNVSVNINIENKPEITGENSGEVKVSESKQKSPSKSKNKK